MHGKDILVIVSFLPHCSVFKSKLELFFYLGARKLSHILDEQIFKTGEVGKSPAMHCKTYNLPLKF